MRSELKLSLVSPLSAEGGGIARCGKFLADALAARSRLHSLIPLAPLYPEFLYPGRMPPEVLTPGASVKWPTQWGKVVRRLKAESPDCVLLPYWTAWHVPGIVRCTRKNFRTIGIFHNLRDHDATSFPGLSRFLVRRFDAIVSHSETVTEAIRRAGYNGPLTTLTEPPPPTPTASPTARIEMRRRFSVPDGMPLVLFSGILRPYKGASDLVEALSQIEKSPWRAVFHVSPWNREVEKLKAQIEERNLESRIQLWSDWIDEENLNALFSAADLVVLPYRSATGSGVLARCFFHRRPVVVTEAGTLAALTEKHGAGWIAQPENPKSLASTLLVALNPNALAKKTQGLRTAVFPSWDDYAEHVWNFALSLVPAHSDYKNAH